MVALAWFSISGVSNIFDKVIYLRFNGKYTHSLISRIAGDRIENTHTLSFVYLVFWLFYHYFMHFYVLFCFIGDTWVIKSKGRKTGQEWTRNGHKTFYAMACSGLEICNKWSCAVIWRTLCCEISPCSKKIYFFIFFYF